MGSLNQRTQKHMFSSKNDTWENGERQPPNNMSTEQNRYTIGKPSEDAGACLWGFSFLWMAHSLICSTFKINKSSNIWPYKATLSFHDWSMNPFTGRRLREDRHRCCAPEAQQRIQEMTTAVIKEAELTSTPRAPEMAFVVDYQLY